MELRKVESVSYEQAPFIERDILALYRNIPVVQVDGAWHDIAGDSGLNSYRVVGRYFQRHIASQQCSLLKEIRELLPMDLPDNADWIIEKHDEGEYLVRSKWSNTFGPTEVQERVDQALNAFDLWLECKGNTVSGAAQFHNLDPKALALAVTKLTWLEAFCIEANRRVTEVLNEYWECSLTTWQKNGGIGSELERFSNASELESEEFPFLKIVDFGLTCRRINMVILNYMHSTTGPHINF